MPANIAITPREAQAFLTVLTWSARADGPVTHRKAAIIARAAGRSAGLAALLSEALWDCESIDFDELRQALEITTLLSEPKRAALVSACVSAAFADGHPAPAAEHAVRFVADAHCAPGSAETVLARAYEARGARIRVPGDPSSFEWWERRGERALGGRTEAALVTARGLAEIRDLAILGLLPDASPLQIREAFRAIARDHHPDRFHDASDDVRNRAVERFRRAREAYERLMPE